MQVRTVVTTTVPKELPVIGILRSHGYVLTREYTAKLFNQNHKIVFHFVDGKLREVGPA